MANSIIKSILVLTTATTLVLNAESNNTKNESTTNKKPIAVQKAKKSNRGVWVSGSSLTNLSKELLAQIKKDKTVAPDLPFYKLYKSIQADIKANKINSKLNKKISKLYYSYMNYLIRGGIDWRAFDKEIARLRKKYDYTVAYEKYPPLYSAKKILNNAIANGSFNNIFSKVEPTRFKYKKLKNYLIDYLEMGNLPTAGKIPTLKVGSSSPAIPKIRKRLKMVGDLSSSCDEPMDSPVYDQCLAKAVKRYKLRHGLKASSVIGKATRLELNRSTKYYIKKMRLNLDRIKWSKKDQARVRIELNIPAFRLYVYDGNDLVTTMRVITGKPDHPTPVFSDVMTTVVVNPYWKIPQSIVRKEMLKKLIKNPHYYEKQGKYLYKGWGPNAKKIDPATVDWKQYLGNKKPIPYNFKQEPGYRNALGKIKFLFPNKYSVYIHDTPGKRLFFRQTRAFSHGCMRIQKPRELLKALSIYNDNVNVDYLMKKYKTNDNQSVALKRRIPIDITYFTAFVDDYGNLHFRKDIYGYDRLMLKRYYKSNYAKASKVAKNSKPKKHKPKKKSTPKKKKEQKIAQSKKKSNDGYEVIEIGY